ncbi:LacI family DNA-binding transcriptional regulator [Devosia rhodophyticola]|uniref:LacI family DNA-binding transcriptional regulator n=1 Tax=Devosia rhodophyticola TaxID=3026423 RepID=A0ABY7YWK1_9HYPH|nr:LacI family DNA-binding transcriptional regulator [Devosia rhodophyticola]WDR05220.1 LacI family DNA-binding transcriptional regulator [Devosia rhodophyticola]
MTSNPIRPRATIREVAAAAGVSMGTVSRVAGGSTRISEVTRARVLAAMKDLSYQPNAAARAMRTNISKTVGMLVPDLGCPVFVRMIAGVKEVLAQNGYMLFTFSSESEVSQEITFLQAARQRQLDGLIVSVVDETSAETARELQMMGVPIVVVDREIKLDADRVFVEHTQAMEALMAQLIAMGHERIGFVTAALNRPGRLRVAAYRNALQRAGITVDPDLMRTDGAGRGAAYGTSETYDLLTNGAAPTALIAAGSDFFFGALKAVRALDLSIPDQLSFVGADDTELAEIAGPPITAIERDMREVGRMAAKLLLDRFAGNALPPRTIIQSSQLVLRKSIGKVQPTRRAPAIKKHVEQTTPAE